MGTISHDGCKRIALLIPRLAKGYDNERLSAINLIDNVLASNKADWHDLAKLVTGGVLPTTGPAYEYHYPTRETARYESPKQEREPYGSKPKKKADLVKVRIEAVITFVREVRHSPYFLKKLMTATQQVVLERIALDAMQGRRQNRKIMTIHKVRQGVIEDIARASDVKVTWVWT